MTIRPDSGPEYGEEERESQGVLPEETENLYGDVGTDPIIADHEAHAPGQVCERCGSVITANHGARRRPDGRWIHEVCPPHFGS
jgi:hypothetical protein